MESDAPELRAQSSTHRCSQCGGETTYDAALQRMRCLHCRHTRPIERRAGAIAKYDLGRGLDSVPVHGYGVPVRSTKCGECGAVVHFGETGIATRCVFCRSPQVLERKSARHPVQPESLIPFRIDRNEAVRTVAAWLKSLWLRPSSLLSEVRLGHLAGMYVPYWAFGARVRSEWTAEAGYHYTETETYTETNAQGETETKTREVRRTRWEPASGSRSDGYDDLLVCASAGLPEDLVGRIGAFETGRLVPYDPQYLVGWVAEEYSVDLHASWQRGQGQIEGLQKLACGRDVPGDTHRDLSVTSTISETTFRHVLLPVWVSAFRYRGEIYRFVLNGQTGELTGQAPPVSAAKLAVLTLVIVTIVVVVSLLARLWLHPGADFQLP